jgi:DNA-binding transcriptional ArsR family regulator
MGIERHRALGTELRRRSVWTEAVVETVAEVIGSLGTTLTRLEPRFGPAVREAATAARPVAVRVPTQLTIFVTAQIVDKPSDAEFVAAAHLLKLLADPTRLRIVWALLHGEHAVAELAEHVGARPTAVSQHLAKLRLAGAVRTRRDGNRIYYLAQNEHIERLAAEALLEADHLVAGGHHHDRKARTA